MKPFFIFTAVFLLAGICSVAAQDLIILKNGNMIEAQVTEISPTEIRYKRFDNLDGPMIVIPIASVLSIRYENGAQEIFDANSTARQEKVQTENPQNTAMNPDKLNFGINASPLGIVTTMGPWICLEFTKGNFNSEINLSIPASIFNHFAPGFGALFTFNKVWHSRIGGGYLGGEIGYAFYEAYYNRLEYSLHYGHPDYDDDGYSNGEHPYTAHSLAIGLNGGYKFVTKSGFYIRTGAFVGFDFGCIWNIGWTIPVYIKPDVAIGWTMR